MTYHGEVLGPGDDARDGADLETLVALQSVAGDVVDEPAALARAQAIIGRVAVAAAASAAAAAEGDQSRSSTPLGNSREKPVRLPAGRAVSEFTPGLFSGAHPELFPFGIGDITLEWAEEEFRTCAFDLKGTETADLKHWMQRLFCAPNGRYAKHPRFLLHLSNIIQRRTAAGAFAMYQQENLDDPDQSAEEVLKELELKSIEGTLWSAHAKTGAVAGTDAYFGTVRRELDSCVRALALRESRWPSYFFSASLAEFHHAALHAMLEELEQTREAEWQERVRAAEGEASGEVGAGSGEDRQGDCCSQTRGISAVRRVSAL